MSDIRSEIEGILLSAGFKILANDTEDLIGELEAAFEEALGTALDRWQNLVSDASWERPGCNDDCPGLAGVDLTYDKLRSLLG